jgi:diguanylate cyclase (GGDEF)-like protein
MSLIPILICGWLVTTYIFPNINLFFGLTIGNISFILFISIVISLLGLYVAKEMIDPVIKIAGDAKIIAEGDITRRIEIEREDEVGDLSKSLNIMTQKIKENMEELKAYSEKTKLINMEINKKVLALSSLLQIGNLISSSSTINNILDFIMQKISDIENKAALFLMVAEEGVEQLRIAASCNLNKEAVPLLKLKQNEIPKQVVWVDKNIQTKPPILNSIINILGIKNLIAMPIMVAGRLYGVLVTGNNESDFVFMDDERELLKVFTKQISIAVENDILVKRSKELAVKDELTGLYNQSYIKTRLEEEIKRAIVYQRPCGYLMVDIDDFNDFSSSYGEEKSGILLKSAGAILNGAVTEIDKVGRLSDDKFAIILPEKNKRQSANIAEGVRKKIEDGLAKALKSDKKITVSIGVTENPIDGSSSKELMEKAEKLARSAKSLGKNRVAI